MEELDLNLALVKAVKFLQFGMDIQRWLQIIGIGVADMLLFKWYVYSMKHAHAAPVSYGKCAVRNNNKKLKLKGDNNDEYKRNNIKKQNRRIS